MIINTDYILPIGYVGYGDILNHNMMRQNASVKVIREVTQEEYLKYCEQEQVLNLVDLSSLKRMKFYEVEILD